MREEEAQKAGGFVVSLDFELMWGVKGRGTLAQHGERVLGARRMIPRLLDLFARYDLGCTWATVGFLLCRDRDELQASLPSIRPDYRDARLSSYAYLHEVGPDERRDPYHFAADLIRRIAETPRQEIGTHTLSHYYCLEQGQTIPAFRADLETALRLSSRSGYAIRSIVFPRNQVSLAALAICSELGVTVYRGPGRPAAGLGVPRGRDSYMRRAVRFADAYVEVGPREEPSIEIQDDMVDVPASLFLRPFSRRIAAAEGVKMHRIFAAMQRAAERGGLFHLWFHPENVGVDQDENLSMLTKIAAEAARLRDRYDWPTLNMGEAAAVAKLRQSSSPSTRSEAAPAV